MEHHIRFNTPAMALELLDQRLLPGRESYFSCRTTKDIVYALQAMVVRGAPAIGVTAAYGCALAAHEVLQANPSTGWATHLDFLLQHLAGARPTAVNLTWAISRMEGLRDRQPNLALPGLVALWLEAAKTMHREDIATNKLIGAHGATLLADGDTVMTHCNAGALATAGFGTALGVIYAACNSGKKISVIANETRPFLQGSRLSAYELHAAHIPVTVACDNACALLMHKKMVQKVIVGADRIAANGDAANKIGTYGVALLAKAHAIPFYVAAPLSTIDRNCPDGSHIPIEERPASEVTDIAKQPIVPQGVPVYNFAFDVTPAHLISGIITEKGIVHAPDAVKIAKVFMA